MDGIVAGSVQRFNEGHVLSVQRKVKNVQIGTDSVLVRGFGQRHDARVAAPSGCKSGRRICPCLSAMRRRIGSSSAPPLARGPHDSTRMPFSRQKAAVAVWWYRGLISSWLTMGITSARSIRASRWWGRKLLTPMGLDPSVPVELFHGFPGFPVELPVVVRMPGGHGPVDQVQVQVVHLKKLHGGVKCPQGAVVSLVRVPDFAGDEYFFPRQGAFTHGAAPPCLLPYRLAVSIRR